MVDAALPCTHCGDCIPSCPERLSPVAIWEALNSNQDTLAVDLGLDRCTGCGDCDRVCPSHISISSLLVRRRDQLRERARMLERAAAARLRFEARNVRLQRDARERSQRESDLQQSATSDDAVEAAIARALARRNAGPSA
jgi:electron transport complex protein RnfC